jgi:predicted dehydrogenase
MPAKKPCAHTALGVVGCGYWGPNLVRNFSSLPNSQVRVICDTAPERLRHLKGLYPNVRTTRDFTELLKDRSLQGIAIATGTRHHYAMAKAALLAGKHTLVEKPMATTSAECEELIALAARQGLVLMVGHTFRYSPAVRKLKEIIESGQLGTVHYISARRLNLGIIQRDINVAWDLAPHDISIALYLMGELPATVTCTGSAHLTPGVEDVTAMSLQFSGNRTALIHSSWLDPRKIREMTVVGSRRMVVYDDVASNDKIRIFDTRVEPAPHYDTYAEFQYAYHYGDVLIPYLRQEEPLKNECADFVTCIRNQTTPLTGGQDGLAVVRILEAASASLKVGGGPVSLRKEPLQSPVQAPVPLRKPAGVDVAA